MYVCIVSGIYRISPSDVQRLARPFDIVLFQSVREQAVLLYEMLRDERLDVVPRQLVKQKGVKRGMRTSEGSYGRFVLWPSQRGRSQAAIADP